MDEDKSCNGARLCEPQQRANVKNVLTISYAISLAELLRVTDPRSASK
jgi:hypothetical protein